jgi:alkanesulfonate monooxygenase SsuD/methylene tetrahydromethanopterin reductase-like flavin-dependent oxidoreductase (luciferase family)
MSDYGHQLQFGTFINPSAHDPDGVVALAQLSEQVGLDLVTFQDHPYNAELMETWTLLSWVAASTERITVAGNVLNLPLRQPALLAKQGATLDILSHGRFAMGIGTGAFWDAMVGMGAVRQTPGESIASLSEAINILRSLWAEAGPRRVRHLGERYTVSGMARGPVLPMRFQSGSAPTSQKCFAWWAKRETAGCHRSGISLWMTLRRRTQRSTRQPSRQVGPRGKSGAC